MSSANPCGLVMSVKRCPLVTRRRDKLVTPRLHNTTPSPPFSSTSSTMDPFRTTAATLTKCQTQLTNTLSKVFQIPASQGTSLLVVHGDYIRAPRSLPPSRFQHAPLCFHSPLHVIRCRYTLLKHPGSSPPNPNCCTLGPSFNLGHIAA